ncbi:MAG: class I tRNA ligase family protein [Candidatus Peribacteria bacterium]|jgi:valyl-tRNA synthetase|nr:class I tRNA ligase family protein [Candidatus Peribacteria bacterium]
MMGEFLVLRQEYSTLTTYETKLHFFPQIQQFIQKKLFARYLEVRKVQTEGSIQATLAIIFSAIFQMLHPFAPAYIQSLLQVSGYQWEPLIHFPSLKKTSLDIEMMFELFEMIYTFKLRLNIKKHQKIILFFKSDPNSLALFTERGKIIKALFNVEQITFVRLHEQNPTGYEIENLHSTIVGIKIQSPATSAKKPTLAELQQQYNQQLEYFELLRNLIINFSTTSYESNPQFDAKKKEMEAVKLRLEKMNLEIQKLKMK